MPALPAHRVMPHSFAGKSATGTHVSSHYGTGYASRSHSHAKKRPTKEMPTKKSSPMIVDRKQAVYNISQGIKSVQKNKVSNNSISTNADNQHASKKHPGKCDSKENTGVYEPVMVRIEIKGGVGERKKLEKDPDGRLYEVVQTRMVEGDFNQGSPKQPLPPEQSQVEKAFTEPTSSPIPKGETVRSNIPYKAAPDDYGGYECCKSPYSERSTQEAISRIKRNVEKKEEFLMRPNDVFSFPPRGAMVYRQYQVCPQKLTPRPIWPPSSTQSTESLDDESQLLPIDEASLRRIKSMKKSYSFDSQPLDQSADTRPISLPASPTTKDDQKHFFPSSSILSMPTNSLQMSSGRPLVRNSIAKPYGSHLVEDVHSKNTKPYFSTLSRIQENLPAASKEFNNNVPSGASTMFLPTTTWTQSVPRFGSESSLSSSKGMRSIPMAWVAENDRVKKLQIVSMRAKKFEPGNQRTVAEPSTKFELTRLSQQDINVSKRREEFENKEGMPPKNTITLDKYGLPTNFEGIVTYIGTRTNPVGGPKIHCEPPHKYRLGIPDKVLERDRSHSVCSHATLWKDRSAGSDLVRQHSFHSTIRSHIAQPPSGEFKSEADQSFVLDCEEGHSFPNEGTRPSFRKPTRPSLLDLKDRALPAANDPYASFCSAGAVGTLHKASPGPFDEAAKNDVAPHAEQVPAPQDKKPVSMRGRIWLGDEHDRLVRRVSYLKATSTDRVLTDSDVDSDEDKSSRQLSVKRTSAVEELPSPASFKASIILHGHLNVKLARHRGKRAGDRSWKSVWGVIRGRALLFYKDKQVALQTPMGPDDQVTLKGSEIGVASDYTKKKNVLRLSTPVGSQFLLQAESEAAMTAWLTSLKSATAQASASNRKDHHRTANPSSSTDPPLPTSATSPTEPASSVLESSPYGDSDRSSRKVTSPRRTRSPSGQVPVNKSRKSTDAESSLKSKTWKTMLGRHLRKIQSGSGLNSPSTTLPHGASIGVCLEDCPPSSENDLIPLLVALCVGVVESKGLHIQGIYRIPGNKAAVNHLIEMVNQGPHAIDLFDTRWSDVNVISSLLKQFFQKLPDPLIPSYLYCHFIEASKTDDPQQRLIGLKNLVNELPDFHLETLRYLISHFVRVAGKSNQNRMDVKNLAIVFGPTLVRAADDSVAKLVTDMSHQCRIVESLITHESWFFSEEEIDEPPPILEDISPSNNSGNNISQMEFNSQTLLLNNIAKLEGNNYKETKKMVSSLISAANRIHKNRGKKIDEDHASHNDFQRSELSEPIPMSQRRISGSSLTTSLPNTDKMSVSSNSLASELTESDKHSMERRAKSNSVSISSSGAVISDGFSTPMGASYLGDELAIRSYAGLSARTQERIRQFERETRAMMLQRDILSRQESQKLESHRKKVEDQLQKAKQDMENEDIFDKMAKNPSEFVPRIGDLLAVNSNRASNKETGRFPSCSISSEPAAPFMASSLTNSYAVATNSSVKNDNYSINDSHEHPVKKVEGSDLLRDMTERFEEKMRSLQHSPFLTTADPLTPTSDYEELNCENYSQGKENSLSLLDAKCHSYRDPSLHRRQSPVDPETFYDFSQVPDMHARSGNLRRTESLSNSDRREKDKSEKRSRELHRIDNQDILREKKPKEWKRSKTQEIHYPIDLLEKFGNDLKSKKQNVRQLKEKFERDGENGADAAKKAVAPRNGAKKKSRIKRRHTVGGTKDLARVALLRVFEAQKGAPAAATWQQIRALVENLADKRYIDPTLFPCDGSSPDINAILSLMAQQSEPQVRLQDANQKSLHPVLESHV